MSGQLQCYGDTRFSHSQAYVPRLTPYLIGQDVPGLQPVVSGLSHMEALTSRGPWSISMVVR